VDNGSEISINGRKNNLQFQFIISSLRSTEELRYGLHNRRYVSNVAFMRKMGRMKASLQHLQNIVMEKD